MHKCWGPDLPRKPADNSCIVLCVVTRTVTYVDTDHMLGWGQGGAGQQPLTGRPTLCGKLGLSVLSSQLNLSSHPCLSCERNGSNFEITASKLDHASIKSCGGKVSLCRIPTTRSFFLQEIFKSWPSPCGIPYYHVELLLRGLTHLHLLGWRGIGSYGQTSLQFQWSWQWNSSLALTGWSPAWCPRGTWCTAWWGRWRGASSSSSTTSPARRSQWRSWR